MTRRLAILAALAVVAACSPATDNATERGFGNGIQRWHDPEYRVVCWTIYGNGITCLPEPEVHER